MTRKNRPYLFYDTTSSVCTTCPRVVEAKIVIKDECVYMDKWCPAHGTERVLMVNTNGIRIAQDREFAARRGSHAHP